MSPSFARAVLPSLCALLFGVACTPRPPPSQGAPPPQVSLYGVRLDYFEGSERVAWGRAVRVTYQRSSGTFAAVETLLSFPHRQDATSAQRRAYPAGMEVRAPVLEGSVNEQRAEGSGGVTLRSAKGIFATSERALFRGGAREVSGTTPITVQGPNYALEAGSYLLRLEDEEFQFMDEVSTQVGEVRR